MRHLDLCSGISQASPTARPYSRVGRVGRGTSGTESKSCEAGNSPLYATPRSARAQDGARRQARATRHSSGIRGARRATIARCEREASPSSLTPSPSPSRPPCALPAWRDRSRTSASWTASRFRVNTPASSVACSLRPSGAGRTGSRNACSGVPDQPSRLCSPCTACCCTSVSSTAANWSWPRSECRTSCSGFGPPCLPHLD